MSLSPVFMLYTLDDDSIMAAWDTSGRAQQATFAQMTDAVGTTTRLWPATDPALHALIRERLADAPLLIADGHHRYETALRYRDARPPSGDPGVEASEAWRYALVYLVNMGDPGLAIFGTHRLVRNLPAERVAALPDALAGLFSVEPLTDEPAAVRPSIEAFLEPHREQGGAFGLWIPAAEAAYGLAIRDRTPMTAAVPDHTSGYRDLDVTILHSLILEGLLGITPEDVAAETHLVFAKEWDEALLRLNDGEFQAGFFMNPTRLDQVRDVALGGERMPQKSTYFYPKLPTGLVFHDLRAAL